MCRHCRHGAELRIVQARIAAEFYTPRCESASERKAALRKLVPRLKAVKLEKKQLRRECRPTHEIDFEYELLRQAAVAIRDPQGFLIESGGGFGFFWGGTYDEARAMARR